MVRMTLIGSFFSAMCCVTLIIQSILGKLYSMCTLAALGIISLSFHVMNLTPKINSYCMCSYKTLSNCRKKWKLSLVHEQTFVPLFRET